MVTEAKVDQSLKWKDSSEILNHNLFTGNERNLDIILKDIILYKPIILTPLCCDYKLYMYIMY